MKKYIFKRLTVVSALGVFSVLLGVLIGNMWVTAVSASSKEYQRNEAGQTYGFIEEGSFSFEEMPDLVAAIATNGKQGYVLKSDLEYINEISQAKNPEDAVAKMNNYYYSWAQGFAGFVYYKTGYKLDLLEIELVLRSISSASGVKCPFELLNDKEKKEIIALLPREFQTESFAKEALENAYRLNEISIPVYMQDGKTVIGEIIIK